MRRKALAAGVLLCLALTVGCSQQHYEERGKADSPVSGRKGEDTAAEVYNFPDGFGNLATKCVGKGKRGYATTRSDQSTDDEVIIIPANAVIVDDPRCTAGS
ncbi:hypothetical protein ACFVWX_01960 [Streptomyces sp. NPDC058220]|uniref:hypothetical protein n=1 Tax=unclassified Streptomyces TaxID=2593676 RepID=UPI0036644FE6